MTKIYTIIVQYPRFRVKVGNDHHCIIQSLTQKMDEHTGIVSFEQIWIGNNDDYEDRAIPDDKKFRGNNILLKRDKNLYYWIGKDILSFHLMKDEKIIEFHSPMGNNDLPYPFAWTSKGRWLLFIEDLAFYHKDVPTDLRQLKSPYAIYYQSIPKRTLWDKIMHIPSQPSSIKTTPLRFSRLQ